MRKDQLKINQLRPVTIIPSFIKHPEGSVVIQVGDTKVTWNERIEDRVPRIMRGEETGWITNENSMLHGATKKCNIHENWRGKVGGRTMEIQRLIGRELRTIVDLIKIGERTVWVDCDVIQADGGTRTASITGEFVAVVLAFGKMLEEKTIKKMPVTEYLAATSVGILPGGTEVLDLNYEEDSHAEVDMGRAHV